jgi:phage/conjugal plasmid C-4 type zinc finger TraR family protein
MVDQFDRAQALELAEYERNQASAILPKPQKKSALRCQDKHCGIRIPKARRKAYPGVQYCIDCQELHEQQGKMKGRYASAN